MQDWLKAAVNSNPETTALIIGDQAWSYRELDSLVDRVVYWLQHARVKADDPVAVLLPNCLEYICLIHALARLQAILIPLNTRLTSAEIAWQIEYTGSKVLIESSATAHQTTGLSIERKITAEHLLFECPYPNPYPPMNLENVQGILFTSGTTGHPKGVMLTFNNFLWSAMASAYRLGTMPEDRWLCCLPLYHVGGLSIVFRCCLYGTTLILQPGFDVAVFADLIQQSTLVSLVPTMLYRLIEAKVNFPKSLRLILLGGAATSPDLLEQCRVLDLPLATTYGLTEAGSQVATLPPQEVYLVPGSVGKPLLFGQLWIVDEQGQQVPGGQYGEIVVQSPTVMAGYFKNPEATAKTLRDGKLYTGDIGYLDGNDNLFIVQRRHDLIVSGGENVYPTEIEGILRQHTAVKDACVVGIAHPEWGQQVAAAVVLAEPIDQNTLIAFCREHLAGYKLPRLIQFVEALPQTASGKIQRHAVQELLNHAAASRS